MLLNGLAILAVVLNHASGWGYTAMVYWADRYRPVTVPNFDQVWSPGFYGLVIINQLALFSVPAFLFVAGFFIAYTSRADARGLSWKVVRARITKLLIPYLIWSVFIFVEEALQGKSLSPTEYLSALITGGATGAYFFVPVLFQFYLLSPLIIRLAQGHARALLIAAAVIQLFPMSIFYLKFFGIYLLEGIYAPSWLCIWFMFYFPLGVVVGFRLKSFQIWVERYRPTLITLSIVFAIVSMLETMWVYQSTDNLALAERPFKLSSELYAIVFILAFLSIDVTRRRVSKRLNWLGARSYGIFLSNPVLLEWTARVIRRALPALLSFQLILTIVLTMTSILIIGLIMEGVARSRMRGAYHYLFG